MVLVLSVQVLSYSLDEPCVWVGTHDDLLREVEVAVDLVDRSGRASLLPSFLLGFLQREGVVDLGLNALDDLQSSKRQAYLLSCSTLLN